jgi:hypothetical protein
VVEDRAKEGERGTHGAVAKGAGWLIEEGIREGIWGATGALDAIKTGVEDG